MSSIKKNFLYNAAYQILIIFTPLITAPIISRALGAEGVGIFTYTSSVVEYFTLFASLGFSNHGIRTISQVRDYKDKLSDEFWSIYYLQLAVSALSVVAFYIYVFFISDSYFNINLIQSLVVISCLFDVSWLFFGLEKFNITVIRNFILRILTLLAVILFVRTRDDLLIHTAIMATSIFLTSFTLWLFLKKHVYFRKPNIKKILKNIKPTLIFFIPNLAVGAYVIMDKIMLGQLSNINDVAFYSNAGKITNIPLGIITALEIVMLPRASYIAKNGTFEELKSTIDKALTFTTFLSGALMFGIAAIGPMFAPIFFGEEFAISGYLTVYLSVTILFKSWNSVIRTQYLIPFNLEKGFILAVISGALINLILNVFLIPQMGSIGAIIATIIAELVVLLVEMLYSMDKLNYFTYIFENFKYLIFGLMMFLVIKFSQQYLDETLLSIAIQTLIGGIFYLFVSFTFYEDKSSIISVIKNNIIKFKNKLGIK